MENFKDLHFYPLPYQGNVYTLATLKTIDGPTKILAASSKREIFFLEFQEASNNLIPTVKEVSFTYIPSGAEIISLDVFNKSKLKNDFVIGVTIIKNGNNIDSLEFYLNIYSEWDENEEFCIENVAQNCLNVELNFTPYQLTHTDLILWKNDKIIGIEKVFLLSGSDNQVHIYREYTTDHLFKEVENKEYFPEFIKTPSPVISIDINLNDDLSQRITVIGCECGYIRLTNVCTKTRKLIFNFSTKFNNFVSAVQLYTIDNKPKLSDEWLKHFNFSNKLIDNTLNLLVINTILPPVVFENVFTYGLSKYFCLPRPDNTNILSCCLIEDIDFDGQKEILIGNSDQEIMFYEYYTNKGWCLDDGKLFTAPIIGLKYIDVLGDGIKELIVLTTKGIMFLQHDFSHVQEVLYKKIEALKLPR